MSFFKRLANLFKGTPKEDRGLAIYAFSRRCREPITGRVDIFNELSQSDDDTLPLYCRKVLHTSGLNRCFDQVEVHLWFDSNKRLQRYEVEGGRWLDADEYAEELVKFEQRNTPEPEDGEADDVTKTTEETETI
ncbi:hypothetical protein KFU94_44550 [Chloroflexi bacterium TSY]|nr:hypothetical protein [Chloroflexi bacterium TSY]